VPAIPAKGASQDGLQLGEALAAAQGGRESPDVSAPEGLGEGSHVIYLTQEKSTIGYHIVPAAVPLLNEDRLPKHFLLRVDIRTGGRFSMAERATSAALSGRRILVVEDEAIVALWIADVLAMAGAVVIGPVGSMREALVSAKHETLDCAVLDYKLLDGTTGPVADLLASRGVPFVFATGYDGSPLDPRYSNRPRVVKVFAPEELLAAILSVLPPHTPID
jgi:CheY-like chemotaxis protein